MKVIQYPVEQRQFFMPLVLVFHSYILKRYVNCVRMLKVQFLLKAHSYVISTQLCYSRNVYSVIDYIVTPETTLTNRLLDYVNKSNQQTVKQNDSYEQVISDLLKNKNVEHFQKYDMQTLLSTFNSLAERHTGKNKTSILALIHLLNSECCQRINELTNKEILNYLHLFMKLLPNGITEIKFYELALEQLQNSRDLDRSGLVQLIFFIGLKKKSTIASQMIRKCMWHVNADFITNLTTEEICVICNSTFKTSTKIKNQLFLDKILKYINDNLNLLKDPAVFVTLLKTIRHNRHQNDDLLSTITCTIFFNRTLQYYSFTALCHILAIYSDYLFYDGNLLNVFIKRCLELLNEAKYISKTTYLLHQPRLKDIERLLWCLSNLNFKHIDKCDIENVVLPQIMMRIKAGEGKHNLLSLIQISLYLWMMDYSAYDLIEYCFSEENFGKNASKLPSCSNVRE